MRMLGIAGMAVLFAAPILAASDQGGHSNIMLYRIINFAILAGALGYLIRKNAGPFFAARSASIQQGVEEAQEMRRQSEQRARAIDERLSSLSQEIDQLRSTAKAEMAAEFKRLEQQAEQSIQKVFTQAEQEITSVAKAARQELKAYTASLAVGLAEKRLAGRITPQEDKSLVGAFIRDLH